MGTIRQGLTQAQAIERIGQEDAAAILRGVAVPGSRALFFTSGLVPAVADSTAQGTARYGGDTYQQSLRVLARIEAVLREVKLDMQDVVVLKIFLAPDPDRRGQIDFEGWFRAYPVYFANAQNPHKVARTTLGVAALARPGLLVEIEAVAVFPE
ncbi:MAG: hypothetical protein HC913_03940 [Microscillaceae bacterium]|nr:hypothetical protein [Microscillaceae bacterium]